MEKPYKPIQCALYDELEIWATYNVELMITYADIDERHVSRMIKIKTLQTKDKVEYLISHDDSKWRLDDIVAIRELPKAD